MLSFKEILDEGGNVKLKTGETAVPIKITPENRAQVQKDTYDMLHAMHQSFNKAYGADLFGKDAKALATGTTYSGSTKSLMNKGISDVEFTTHKKEAGDIDVKIPQEHMPTIAQHLTPGQKFGKYTYVGMKSGGAEHHAIMRHDSGEHHQLDFEKSAYSDHEPSEFDQFAHSADWSDTKLGIKGVHHKQLLNAVGTDQHKFSILYGIGSRTNKDAAWENSIEKMTKTLFGSNADAKQLHSFQGIVQLIKKHIPKSHHQAIYDKFKGDVTKTNKHINNKPALELLRKQLGVKDTVAEDALNEFDHKKHVDLIRAHMHKLGYDQLGDGTDAQVFAKKTGPVIKILVPESGDIKTADNTFLAFYDYCQKNKSNPHLPKFVEVQGQHHATFEMDGEQFRQIAMERLQELDPDYDDMILDMVDDAEQNKPLNQEYKKYAKFYETMKSIISTGRKLDFSIDIMDFNNSNVMQRGKTLVIMDPWVTTSLAKESFNPILEKKDDVHHASVIPLTGFSPISHMGHALDLGAALKKLPGAKHIGVSNKADLYSGEERKDILSKQWKQSNLQTHLVKSGGETIANAYNALPKTGEKHLNILVGHDRKDFAQGLKASLEAGKIKEMGDNRWTSITIHHPEDSDRSHGMSGTAMRTAAEKNDLEQFHKHLGPMFSSAEAKKHMEKFQTGLSSGQIKVKRPGNNPKKAVKEDLDEAKIKLTAAQKIQRAIEREREKNKPYAAAQDRERRLTAMINSHDQKKKEDEKNESVLGYSQRLARGQRFKRMQKRLLRTRVAQAKRFADPKRLKGRAVKDAYKLFRARITGGKNYASLSTGEKISVDTRLQKMLPGIKKLAARLVGAERQKEMQRKQKAMMRRESTIDELFSQTFNLNEVAQDSDIKNKEGTQPKKYYAGLDKNTKELRSAHFEKNGPKSDSDKSGYEDAPGDKEAREKGMPQSKHTLKFKKMYGESMDRKESSRLDQLVRMGLADTKMLSVLKRSMEKLKSGDQLSTQEKSATNDLLSTLLDMVLSSDSLFGMTRKQLQKESVDDKFKKYFKESMDDYEDEYEDSPEMDGVEMAQIELANMIEDANDLLDMLDEMDEEPDQWVLSKITKAADYIATASDYLQFEDGFNPNEVDDEDDDGEYSGEIDDSVLDQYTMDAPASDYGSAYEEFRPIIEEIEGLQKKAEKSGISYSILKQVYNRGMAAWQGGHRPGTTPQQWAFARVNSFITKGQGTWGGADSDLASKVKKNEEFSKFAEALEWGTDALRISYARATPGQSPDIITAKYSANSVMNTLNDITTQRKKKIFDEETSCCGDCKDEIVETVDWENILVEADYQGKTVKLNDPFRTPGENKKFGVYTMGPNGDVVIVRFGDPNMEIKRDDPDRRASFRARHGCDNPGPKWKANYWSCYQWRAGSKVDS